MKFLGGNSLQPRVRLSAEEARAVRGQGLACLVEPVTEGRWRGFCEVEEWVPWLVRVRYMAMHRHTPREDTEIDWGAVMERVAAEPDFGRVLFAAYELAGGDAAGLAAAYALMPRRPVRRVGC